MKIKFIEATENSQFNWGKFMVAKFEQSEWDQASALDKRNLLRARGWTPDHLLVLDIQTGEGAVFRHGGLASHDLNERHQIWVCPMYEPFLNWLYKQDVTDLTKLPSLVNLGDVPTAMSGYRRKRKQNDRQTNRSAKGRAKNMPAKRARALEPRR